MTWFLYCVLNGSFDLNYHCVPNWLLSKPFHVILSLCTQLIPFKTIWPNCIIVYPVDYFEDYMAWFLHCVPNGLLSRPFDLNYHCAPSWLLPRQFHLILSLYTQITPFKTIWPDICIVYPVVDPVLSRPFDLILLLGTILGTIKNTMQELGHMVLKGVNCRFEFKSTTLLISFQTREGNQGGNINFSLKTPTKSMDLGPNPQILWFLGGFKGMKSMDFCLVYPIDSFQDIWPNFIIVYPVDSFQDHMTWFLYCVPNWRLSRPFDLILLLCTQLTPFKTIWPNFIIVYPIDSFQDHLTWFLYCVPNWLLSRLFNLILTLCTQITPFKTISPNFVIVYPIDCFQYHMTWFLYCVCTWLLSRPYNLIFVLCIQLIPSRPFDIFLSLCTQLTPFKTRWPNFCIVYLSDSFQDHLT